ncbi:hypothetical protein LNV08_11680 [Paucibacter sp. TC2R-5]|uniref:hypothetical protein n=1 Tax=Paucibacter sp. TC2R-5 TaxID=2893555 RepID=UPI0021E4B58E|nr:hypothetical protein [Paucibacter sp. TC2R-5]MCV2359629.1 hypothetical protein [Paucibacter sp. TC2R-5]
MFETAFLLISIAGVFAFAPRVGAAKAWPGGAFPWVSPALHVSDWTLAGTVFVMVPMTYFNLHSPLWLLGLLTGSFSLWVVWAWLVSAWRA